ncbi:MAG: CocE/NonD family hydrolase, partial [Gemmatimonadetes bacterium]|nr:CocE/NonD family hydrolase [Gemmatimonadota bacterium]
NTRHGDGRLSTEPPGEEPPDAFRYDPMDPVPTQGGPLCCVAPALAAGQFDHSAKEERRDVLIYSTPPLEHDLEVTGPVTVTLWAASSAPDTDFTAMLLDVGPCGCARNLADGIVRARYRNSLERAEPITAGAVEKYEIDLVATSNVFKKGHSIRVEMSSSNFPRFDRNLNTGKSFDDAEVRVATNTVFHDAAHPTHITLDVVPA